MKSKNKENIFTASISHELRTPLTSILGYGDLLSSTKLDNKQKEYLSRMIRSSEYLLSLVGDFLDIVRMENREIQLKQKEARLHAVLTECAETIKGSLHEDVYFKSNIPFLDYTICIDEKRLKQVILNLLSNASKFTKSGMISLGVKKIEDHGKKIKVIVEISDTGKGMTKEMQKSLFEPFTTGDSTQGIGLGLHISKEIMKLMGGKIKVHSNKGKGSTFTLSFFAEKMRDKKKIKNLSGANIGIVTDNTKKTKKTIKKLKSFGANVKILNPNLSEKDVSNLCGEDKTLDMIVFDMDKIPHSISKTIYSIRKEHIGVKCIGLIRKEKINQVNADFDKIIISPIKTKDFAFQIEEVSTEIKKDDETVDFSKLKVLVVEDVEMSKEYIVEMLKRSFSIECDTASNGKEAVDKAKEKNYDIIFMDIRMPIMDGYTATKNIRKFNKETSIICMSADVYEDDVAHAKKAGMDYFIGKPLDKKDIKNHLLQIAGHSGLEVASVFVPQKEHHSLRDIALSHLKENFDDETSLRLLATATGSIEKYILDIKESLALENKKEEIADTIHALKGVLANLGLKQQVEDISKVETRHKESKEKDSRELLLFVEELHLQGLV